MYTSFVSFLVAGLMILAGPLTALALDPATPTGCNTDRSVVNITRSTASASVGETITFTVEAGNPISILDDGCDIEDRTMTLTLPNGITQMFGPVNYAYPTPLTIVGSVDYVATQSDLINGSWTATVSWTGIQKDGFDSVSTGSKGTSVVYVPTLLSVTKTATPTFDRTFTWSIDKSVDQSEHVLTKGQSGISNYTISVDQSTVDSNYEVSGTITVQNPSVMTATITGITDVMSDLGNITVDCPISFPYALTGGAELVCTYTSTLPDATLRTNTVTVATVGDVEGNSAQASVDFEGISPTIIGFNEVTITDTNSQFLGPKVIQDDTVFNYDVSFDCPTNEGNNPNTAGITETGQSDDASVTIVCANPSIDIEKATNGEDADTPTGPTIVEGNTVNWTYVVTNTGDVPLTDIVVTDDQNVSVSCPETTLAVDASMTCTASGIAIVGQYANLGSVSGNYQQTVVTDSDPSHYLGSQKSVEYCSPGYWKQSQHFTNWNGYSPDQSFSSVFGETISVLWSQKGKPGTVVDPTLLQALQANGGGINMLARATVGALLNAAILDTALTPAEVVSAFADTYPGSNANYQTLAALFTTEHNCPLGN